MIVEELMLWAFLGLVAGALAILALSVRTLGGFAGALGAGLLGGRRLGLDTGLWSRRGERLWLHHPRSSGGAGSPCPGAHHRQRRPLAGSMSEGTVATRQPGLLMHGSRRVERRRPVPV